MNSFSRRYHRTVARIVSMLLSPDAVSNPKNFDLWESRGYHITPNHYHSPIPDTRELAKNYPEADTAWGIDFRLPFQLKLIKEVFPKFQDEYNAFPLKKEHTNNFFLYNDGFCGIDPHVYHCMIRHFNPRRIIEVGSGHSTLLGYEALRKNDEPGELIVIDPSLRDFTSDFISTNQSGLDHIPIKVEDFESDLFLQLKEGDMLFIDSSHVVRIGGDVCFLILEILPRLKAGVLIHFHDIYLPSNYPAERVIDGHMFWSEQYLLQAYLTHNPRVEVIFSSNYFALQHLEVVKKTFPNAIWWTGESFWIRKR